MASMLVIEPMVIHEPAPESPPPELDPSSSKSSSARSSSLAEISIPDVTNFEDISLDDVNHVLSRNEFANGNIKRHNVLVTRHLEHQRPTAHQDRPVPHKNGSPPPILRLVSETGQTLPLQLNTFFDDGQRRRRRNIKPSSTPASYFRSRSVSSRSPSPQSPHSLHSSNTSLSATDIPRWSSSRLAKHPITLRRSSWQPGRKSVRDLENEYHDSDEEIPEDAVVWNVPISPRPPNARASPRGSVAEAEPISKDLRLGPPSALCDLHVGRYSLPALSSQLAGLRRSVSMMSMADRPESQPCTKTRDSAMSDLSIETQVLTEVLESYAEENERQREAKVQSGAASARQESEKAIVSVSAIELPPLRKGDVMIDPLPASKEKEKFLTRTRPSWLPPKNPKEEKRHLKEYQQMMALSLQAENTKALRQQEQNRTRDTTCTSLARIWQEHVLPNWSAAIAEPRTRHLWWRGVTPRDRGLVWQRAIGNGLGLSQATYQNACRRVHAAEVRLTAKPADLSTSDRKLYNWFAAIEHDASEAFPELRIFQPEGPLHRDLVRLLKAYAMYRPDVGYVHGIHCVAALLLLNLDTPAAFSALANLVNRPIPTCFYTANHAGMCQIYQLVLDAVAYKVPTLHSHLSNPALDLDPSLFLKDMLSTMFCSAKYGIDIASRIMDIYVFEGDKMLIRSAVGTLMRLEPSLYGDKSEILAALSCNTLDRWALGADDDFLNLVREAGKVDVDRRTD